MLSNLCCRTTLLGALIVLLVWNAVRQDLQAEEITPVKSLLEMRHRNVAVQEWDLSCGAAALTTLLDYQYGDQINEREVAIGLMKRPEYIENPKLVQIREGFSLLDLKRFVDQRGYQGVGLGKLNLTDLIERAPIMVPIRANGYNHFVIFRGIAGNRVLLADPAWGNRTLLKDDFEEMWINFPKIGHVGFVVMTADGKLSDPHRLAPRADDFVFFR
jgi:predicted double-glycine peptidase